MYSNHSIRFRSTFLAVSACVALAVNPVPGGAYEAPHRPDPGSDDHPSEPGLFWTQAPRLPPGVRANTETPTLDDLREAMTRGDRRLSQHVAKRIVDEARWGPDRTLAAFVLGMSYREQELHNLASEAFTIVRTSQGPLAEWGAYYEAEQDLKRGKPWVAIRECEVVRQKWPSGRFDRPCQRIIARALVQTGNTQRAKEMAAQHDAAAKTDAIGEQIELAIAKRWSETHPELAIPLLKKLVIQHNLALTGRVAEQMLEKLAADGLTNAHIPDDPPSMQVRALSLREVKRKEEAYEAFQQLRAAAPENSQVQAWVESERPRFLWRTHRWDELAEHHQALHDAAPSSATAWDLYKALDRAGRFKESLAVALSAQRAYGRSPQWSRAEEIVARSAMLAQNYEEARVQWDRMAARGGWAARRAELYGAISSVLAGSHEDAIKRLSSLIERNRTYLPHARYWRAKALDAIERTPEADADRSWILEQAPRDWYATLVRQRGDGAVGPPWVRSGRWPSPVLSDSPDWEPSEPLTSETVPVSALPSVRVAAGLDVWSTLTWPLAVASPRRIAPQEPAASEAFYNVALPPISYRTSAFANPDSGLKRIAQVAKEHGATWPEWSVIHDFARVGLYDLSGPLLSSIYEEWKVANTSSRSPRHAQARKISARGEDWRPMFYAARDHHHTDRFTYGLWDTVQSEADRAEALRLGWPLAHDHYVWRHSRINNVDPYLVMAIMRIESRYHAVAVSPVGARGAMQIMPKTGALIANLRNDEDFLTADLEDPVFAVGYGIYYLGQLLERFDGAYPLAVAAYNGGPFNVSAWLRGAGDLPMDAFVEHIPFRETRRYVRSVSAAYQTYLDLYGLTGEVARLPAPPYADDPLVVDF